MKEIITWLLISGSFFLIFIALFLLGIIRKKQNLIIISLLFILLFIISSAITGFKLASGAWGTIKDALTGGRTGEEIYNTLFGKSTVNCVKVGKFKDQIVPGLDCCIWLEFTTCPAELQRIVAQEKFVMNKIGSAKVKHTYPVNSERPQWWTPEKMSDTILLFEYRHAEEDRNQYAYVSSDCTKVFYCDLLY